MKISCKSASLLIIRLQFFIWALRVFPVLISDVLNVSVIVDFEEGADV